MNSHIIPTQLGSGWVLYWPHLASSHLGLLGPLPLPGTLNRCTIYPQVLHVALHRFSATTIYLLSGPCSVFISLSAPQSLHCTLHRFSATMILVPHSEEALFAKKIVVLIFLLFFGRDLCFQTGPGSLHQN